MNELIAFLNAAGKGFVNIALPMLIQSSLMIVIVLVADLLLRWSNSCCPRRWRHLRVWPTGSAPGYPAFPARSKP